MTDKNKDDDQLIDDINGESELEFDQGEEMGFTADEDLLLDDEVEDDLIPSVLYKGIARPKTEEDWRQLLLEANRDRQSIPEFNISDIYREGDLIHHPLFDIGVVSKVITPRKMEVVFETDKKLMAMNTIPLTDTEE
jgi:hypothetical protein